MATPEDIIEAKRIANARAMAQKTASPASTPAVDPYYVRDPKTGLSPAQIEANQLVAEAAKTAGKQVVTGDTGESNRVFVPYEMGSKEYLGKTYSTAAGAYSAAVNTAEKVGPPGPAPAGLHWNLQGTEWKLYDAEGKPFNYLGTSGEGFTGDGTSGSPLMYNGKPFSGVRGGVTYVNGVPKGTSDGTDTGGNVQGYKTVNGVLTYNGVPFTGSYNGKNYKDGLVVASSSGNFSDGSTGNINTGNLNTGNVTTGPTLAKDVFKQTLALYFGDTELTKGWMDELYNAVSKFYRNGTDVATSLNMALLDSRNNPNLKAFTDRFKGIYALQDLRQAGKPVSVPTIAEYVAAQKGMADILNEAGLGDISTEQFTGELIGKGNSVSTVADKIGNVYQRIDMAPKEIKDVLGRYFPTVDRTTLAKTILLGEKGVAQLVDELNKYDVLAAAEQQGIAATGAKGIVGGVTEERAGEYARGGGTYASLLPKFAQVKRVTPELAKLSGISKVKDIGQLGVEQAIISGLSQPMETIQQLGEEEIGRFSGKAGRAELGLASQRRANRAF